MNQRMVKAVRIVRTVLYHSMCAWCMVSYVIVYKVRLMLMMVARGSRCARQLSGIIVIILNEWHTFL